MDTTKEIANIAKILTPQMVKYKISLHDTLLSLKIDQPYIIKVNIFKASQIRRGADFLKKKGYLFTVTEKDRVDDVIVTRLK